MPTSKGQIRQTLHCGSLSVPMKAHKGHILGGRVGIRIPTAGTWESLCSRTSQHSQTGRELALTPVEESSKAEQSVGGSTEGVLIRGTGAVQTARVGIRDRGA